MTNDLISRKAALDVLRNAMNSFHIVGMRSGKTLLQSAVNEAFEGLNNLPAIDAAPVVHGRWKYFHKQNIAVCLNCSFERDLDANFGAAVACPNCGALMK